MVQILAQCQEGNHIGNIIGQFQSMQCQQGNHIGLCNTTRGRMQCQQGNHIGLCNTLMQYTYAIHLTRKSYWCIKSSMPRRKSYWCFYRNRNILFGYLWRGNNSVEALHRDEKTNEKTNESLVGPTTSVLANYSTHEGAG